MIGKIIGAGAGGLIAINVFSAATGWLGRAENEPSYDVSINLPAYYENTDTLLKTIESLKNQNIIQEYPHNFEIVLLACDDMDLEALAAHVDRSVCTGPGKLTARDAGFRASEGEIIVSVDADTIYPPNWLNRMLRPFNEEKDVVATTSRTMHIPFDLVPYPFNLLYYNDKVLGRGSCVLKEAYFEIGGFDLLIDQSDWDAMIEEEEIGFKQRLERIGAVRYIDVPHFTWYRSPTPKRTAIF